MPGLGSSWQHLCCQIASQERVLSSMMSSVMKGEVLMMTKSSSVMKGEAVDAETFQGHVAHKPCALERGTHISLWRPPLAAAAAYSTIIAASCSTQNAGHFARRK